MLKMPMFRQFLPDSQFRWGRDENNGGGGSLARTALPLHFPATGKTTGNLCDLRRGPLARLFH